MAVPPGRQYLLITSMSDGSVLPISVTDCYTYQDMICRPIDIDPLSADSNSIATYASRFLPGLAPCYFTRYKAEQTVAEIAKTVNTTKTMDMEQLLTSILDIHYSRGYCDISPYEVRLDPISFANRQILPTTSERIARDLARILING